MTLLSVLLLFGGNIVAVGWLVFLPGGRLRRYGAEVGTIVCLRLRSSRFLFFGVFIDAFKMNSSTPSGADMANTIKMAMVGMWAK